MISTARSAGSSVESVKQSFCFARVETPKQILNSLPGEEQSVLRNQLVGAFQSPDMYKRWKESDATACTACGQEDICQLHTFLFCPATAAVREDWCDLLKDLSPADKHALILPRMPELQASDDIWPTCYPTGSVQTGPVSLWQTVARAELTAILVSLNGANHAVVYSARQCSVNLVNNILCQPGPKQYWKADNFDLVLAVCAIAPACQAARICKIEAHQDLCAIPEPLAKYHAIGNAMADTAANAARATGFLDTTELISDLQASAALARAKTRMTMQFCAQAPWLS